MDYDLLIKLGWTSLIGWNLRETISLGKRLVRLEAKLDNGLTSKLDELKAEVERHIDGEEQRIISAIIRDPGTRTRRTD